LLQMGIECGRVAPPLLVRRDVLRVGLPAVENGWAGPGMARRGVGPALDSSSVGASGMCSVGAAIGFFFRSAPGRPVSPPLHGSRRRPSSAGLGVRGARNPFPAEADASRQQKRGTAPSELPNSPFMLPHGTLRRRRLPSAREELDRRIGVAAARAKARGGLFCHWRWRSGREGGIICGFPRREGQLVSAGQRKTRNETVGPRPRAPFVRKNLETVGDPLNRTTGGAKSEFVSSASRNGGGFLAALYCGGARAIFSFKGGGPAGGLPPRDFFFFFPRHPAVRCTPSRAGVEARRFMLCQPNDDPSQDGMLRFSIQEALGGEAGANGNYARSGGHHALTDQTSMPALPSSSRNPQNEAAFPKAAAVDPPPQKPPPWARSARERSFMGELVRVEC